VPVVRKCAQIVDPNLHQSLGERAADDAVLKDAGEEPGKDGDYLEAHIQRS
jgi:hypothetical protein